MLGITSINLTDSNKINAKQKALDEKMNPGLTGINFMGTYSYKVEVWWYFIKKSFFDETCVAFYNRKFVQDSYLTPTIFSEAKKMTFIEYDLYPKSPNSITRKKPLNIPTDILRISLPLFKNYIS